MAGRPSVPTILEMAFAVDAVRVSFARFRQCLGARPLLGSMSHGCREKAQDAKMMFMAVPLAMDGGVRYGSFKTS